jgi:hypothetical protein
MKMDGEDASRAFYKCLVPAIAKGESPVTEIEYYFDFRLDRTYNRRNEKNLVIK